MHLTQNKIRSTKTLFSPAEGDSEGLTEEDGEADPDGEALLEGLLDVDAEGLREGEFERLGLGEGLFEAEGESERL